MLTSIYYQTKQLKTLERLHKVGQNLWLGHASRALLYDGSLLQCIEDWSITGVSFCPIAFGQAISSSTVYDNVILKRIKEGLYGEKLACNLILEDVRFTADLLRHVHERTDGVDGWAVLPVSPLSMCDKEILAKDISKLYNQVNRPNVLVTVFGLPSNTEIIESIIFNGIPLNISSIYSDKQYLNAAGAYLRAIERRIDAGLVPTVPTFISISISRLASELSKQMPSVTAQSYTVAMARKIYKDMRTLHGSRRWERAYNAGAKPLKLIWGCLGLEPDEDYDPSIHTNLIAPFTVASLPSQSIERFIHSECDAEIMISSGGNLEKILGKYEKKKQNIDNIIEKLQDQDVAKEIKTWIMLLEVIARKSATAIQKEVETQQEAST